MNTLPLWAYPCVLVSSLLLSLVLTPLALAVALRFGVFDEPGPAKSHRRAVPYLGGTAIVTSFAIVVAIAAVIRPPTSGLSQLAALLGLGVALALIGLIDDLRGGVSALLRLALEVAAGALIYAVGDSAHIAHFPSWLNAVLSITWIVVVTNAFNLLDNMDGASAGIAALTSCTIFGIAYLEHRYLVAALAIALAGCAIGFLRHNFHPATIFMGDTGSLFLGFVLAVLLLKLRDNLPTRVSIAAIVAAVGVPLFDTALVVWARATNHRSPFAGGMDHLSHRLVRLGLSIRATIFVIYLAGILLDGIAIVLAEYGHRAHIAGVAGVVALGAISAWFLLRVDVYQVGASENDSRASVADG